MNQLNQKAENSFVSKLFSLQKIDKSKSFVQKQPPEVFFKETVSQNLQENTLGLQLYLKKTPAKEFSSNFLKFLRTPFSQKASQQLLLFVSYLKVLFCKEVSYIYLNLLLLEKMTKTYSFVLYTVKAFYRYIYVIYLPI